MFKDVLHFWFTEIEPSQWFVKDFNFDELIKSRFLSLHEQAFCSELFSWRETAKGRLAEIIVLDQFSRNIYRDSPNSFSSDTLALALSQEAIRSGADNELSPIENSFLYMPFMHSESKQIHEVAVDLYTKNGLAANLEFELKHKVIIDKFGRYPHRNTILNRESTESERSFLLKENSSF
jgi:uncharacterized protein (DUF924 family)